MVRTNRSHQGDLQQVRLFLRFPPLYILDFTVYLLYFLALSPLSMPIQYLFKHYFMPLARETFTFKFSNIPQSLVCKQHMSVLQLLPLSEAVGIKPSHARRGRRGGGPGLRRGHRTARPASEAVHPAGCRGGRAEQRVKHPPRPGTRLGKGLLFQRGSTQRAIQKILQKRGEWGDRGTLETEFGGGGARGPQAPPQPVTRGEARGLHPELLAL